MNAWEGLRAVKLLTWQHTPESAVTGSLEWAQSGWVATGEAGWLLTDYQAGLRVSGELREVTPDEGVLFLYAVWYSMRASYLSVQLLDAQGEPIERADLLAELSTVATP